MSDDENTKIQEAFWELWLGSVEEGESYDLEDMWYYIKDYPRHLHDFSQAWLKLKPHQ